MKLINFLDESVGAEMVCAASDTSSAGAAFAIAQLQMEKLSSIHAQSGVEWEVVAGACVKVLREEGKDLTAAVWLLCAWVSLCGVSGLVNGVRMLRGMIEQHWEIFTPPLVRLRARRNQIEWMLDWLDVKLNQDVEPVMAGQLVRLLDDWDAIEVFWREQDIEAPSFFRLRRRLADLPVEASAIFPVMPASVESDAVAVSAVAVPVSSPLVVVEPLRVGTGAVEKVINDTLATFGPLIEICLQEVVIQPLLLRLNRQRAWLTLEAAPLSQGNTTRLPSPPQAHLESFARVQEHGEPLDIVRFCEERLVGYPYWLDLNRASHAALSRLGEEGAKAAASVALECQHLLARLPTLGGLTFADGQPFADGVTRGWLDSLMPSVRCGEGADAIQALIVKAEGDAVEGRLSAALRYLQVGVESVGCGRDRFRLRHAQCELLHRFDPQVSLSVALDVLLQEAQVQALDRWEPALVRPLLELLMESDEGARTSVWGKQLASMDLLGYWRLASSHASDS